MLGTRPAGGTLTEIARTVGASASTCLNVLRTLVSEGVLTPLPGKRYALASGWSDLAGLLEAEDAQFLARSQPQLTGFSEEQDVTTGLWRIQPGGRIELVALGESRSSTRIHMAIGQRQPLGAGSIGRALAAAQDLGDQAIARRYRDLRWREPLSLDGYREQIRQAAKDGYAVDDGYAFAGICSVACVIAADPPVYCLSATTFAGERDPDQVAVLGNNLARLAESLGIGGERGGRRSTT